MKLFYREYGKGYPMIILHGLFGISDNWQSLAKRFGKHFHVFVPDQRNHGRSPHSDIFTYEVLTEDLKEFIEDHEIDNCHILGHSMGGKTGMRFAMEFPDHVRKLIVADIAPKYYPVLHKDIIDALINLNFNKIKDRKEAFSALKEKIPQPSIRQFLLKNLKRESNRKLAWRINLQAIKKNIENISDGFASNKSCDCPALFIRGDLSYYVHDSDITEIERLFPESSLKTIGGASHWLHAEKPDEFYELVMQFLSEEN
jgi:pimeloyl-ACP methyl ester carboxylesterase